MLIAIGGLTNVGLYLITARSLSRIILGFAILGHASVLALLLAGGSAAVAPIAGSADVEELANPVPQALALTAIVISFGLTLFLLALAGRQQALTGDDQVEDDLEDRRLGGRGIDGDDDDESVDGESANKTSGQPEANQVEGAFQRLASDDSPTDDTPDTDSTSSESGNNDSGSNSTADDPDGPHPASNEAMNR